METRYIPYGNFSKGRGLVFKTERVRKDGTMGYTLDELSRLSPRDIDKFFRKVKVEVVEQATAAPGESRKKAKPKS